MSRSIDALIIESPDYGAADYAAGDQAITAPDDALAASLDAGAIHEGVDFADARTAAKANDVLAGPPQAREGDGPYDAEREDKPTDQGGFTDDRTARAIEIGRAAQADVVGGSAGDAGNGRNDGGKDGPGDNNGDPEAHEPGDDDHIQSLRHRDLMSHELPAATAARLEHDRAEAISQAYMVMAEKQKLHDIRAPLSDIDHSRTVVSQALLQEYGSPRYVVNAEDARVAELLGEEYIDPHAGEGRAVQLGREMLERAGLRAHDAPQLVERPYLEESQAAQSAAVKEELDASRELIRTRIFHDIDGAVIDESLGLRQDQQTILPNHFKQLHHQAEAELGRPTSFTEWMAEVATDEQLLNVLQWHDHYLKTLDEAPEFQAQVERVSRGYVNGMDAAITDGTLHPAMRQEGNGDGITIRHGSPLSPLMAVGHAYLDPYNRTIYVRQGVSDYSMYHERTHLDGGLGFAFNEAATEAIAHAVYSHADTADQPYDLANSAYSHNIATMASLDAMTGGHVGLYEVSEFFAGPHSEANGAAYGLHVDDEIGLPVCQQVVAGGKEVHRDFANSHDLGTATLARNVSMRLDAELMEKALLDDQGNRLPQSLGDIAHRLINPENIDTYGPNVVFRCLRTVALASLYSSEDIEE